MADWAQVGAHVRFNLEQLSQRNAQHEFEHLCRHLARARICLNILPATGPVQSGGDQGRDFETFRSHLVNSPLRNRSFIGLLSDKMLAFACTLEKKTKAKIKKDVETIVSGEASVDEIHHFCSRDVPVSTRHELQNWARETFAVHLEIYDGTAISEGLCAYDVFWIAERFLHLPAEIVPPPPSDEAQDWYGRMLNKWRREKQPAQTFADFAEIRAAARVAIGPFVIDENGPGFGAERPELPFWIERLDEIAANAGMNLLRRRALYETSVLRLRGLGALIGQEDLLREYFTGVPELEDAPDLEDASVLLTYCMTATGLGQVYLEQRELETWQWAIEKRVEERLRYAKSNDRLNERCALLEVLGHMALCRNLLQGQSFDAGTALKHWSKLARLAARAPLFPLERFADRLAQHARFIGQHSDYEPLTETVDTLVAERFGAFKAAEKCLQRAIAFREAGDLPRAMTQLHRAKIDWFAEETIGKSLIALLWLGQAYNEQGLFFAAKYYTLAAAFITLHASDLHVKPFLARSLERAAECDYALGAWHGFLELAETAATFYPHFARDPDADFNNLDGVLNRLMFYLGLVPTLSHRFHPLLEPFARERCICTAERLGLADVLDEVQAKAEEVWVDSDSDTLWRTLEEQLPAPLWSDAGPLRRVTWRAHGVTWNFEWANDYESTVAAEEFLATFQIFLSDLAGQDLCLLCSMMNVSLQLAADSDTHYAKRGHEGFNAEFVPSNTDRRCVVTLPPARVFREGQLSRQDLMAGALAIGVTLLAEVSLLLNSDLHQLLDERFREGLSHKMHIGGPYGRVFREFIDRETFEASQRAQHSAPQMPRSFQSRLPEGLPWFDGPGPGYSAEAAREQIQNRYAGFARPIGRTLQRLAREPEVQATLARLRAEGWRDWHLLNAIFHTTLNYRMNRFPLIFSNPKEELQYWRKIMRESEPENALLVPLEEYSEEKLRQNMRIGTVSALQTYGLEIHQLTPDFEAVEHFLGQRYNYWTDDIEHEDPFRIED